MDLEGKNAATTLSVREIDADGKGKASGSSGEGAPPAGPDRLDVQPGNGNFQPSAGRERLNVEPAPSPVPDSALRARELHEPADQPAQISIPGPEATKRPDPEDGAAARKERIDALERDGRSELPGRKS